MKAPMMVDRTSSPDHLASRAARAQHAWSQVGLHLRTVTPRGLTRCVLLAMACVVIAWLLWSSRSVLIPFEVGAALAYVLAPLVNLLARRLPRSAAIVVVFAGALVLLVAFLLYLVPTLLHQLTHLAQTLPRPDEMAQLVHRVQAAVKHLPRGVQSGITAGLTQASATLKANLAAVVNHVIGFMATVVFSLLNTILFLLGFAVVPVWLFFLFQSGPAQRAAVYRTLPTAMRADARTVLRIADRVFSTWIRGQIILSLFLGLGVFVGLNLLALLGVKGIQYTLLLAVFAAVVAPIPYIGGFLGLLPAVVMALFSSWQGAVAVLALYVTLMMIHDNVLSPKIMSTQLGIDPAILMPLMIVLGRFGLIWVILAAPVAAVSRDLFRYVYGRCGEPPRPAGQLPGDAGSPAAEIPHPDEADVRVQPDRMGAPVRSP